MCRHTQFTTVGKHFTTIGALVWFLAPVAAFMAVQGGLTSEYLAADGAFKVFICCSISMRYQEEQDPNATGEESIQLLCVKKCPCSFDFWENGSCGRWHPSQQQ